MPSHDQDPRTTPNPPPNSTGELLALGAALLEGRRLKEAGEAFQRVLETGGDQAAAWLGLSEVRRESGEWDSAATAAVNAKRLRAAAPPAALAAAHTAHALALLGGGRDGEALTEASLGVALVTGGSVKGAADPRIIAAARRALALALLRKGRLDEAEKEIEAALEAVPDYPEGLVAKALTLSLRGRSEEADTLFRQATSAKETMAEAFANHAALLAQIGRAEEALRTVARAVRLKPFLPGPLHLLGSLLRQSGRTEEAVAAFSEALRFAPHHLDAWVNLADSLRLLGRPRDAMTACEAGLRRHPDDLGLLTNLGTAAQEMGDRETALAAYGRVIEAATARNGGRRPDLPEIDNNVAGLHHAAGRIDEALLHIGRARAARPTDPGFANNQAAILLAGGRPEAAEAPARLRVALKPKTPDAHLLLARILAQLDRPEEADVALARAIRLAPSDPNILIQGARAFLLAGRRPRAINHLRRAIRVAPDDTRCWALLGQALTDMRPTQWDEAFHADLLAALNHPGVEISNLLQPSISLILLSPGGTRLLEASEGRDPTALAEALDRGLLDPLSSDPLITRLLEAAVIPGARAERALAGLRHALAMRVGAGNPLTDSWFAMACALACQCHLNEYVWDESVEEGALIDRLEAGVRAQLDAGGTPGGAELAILGAYRPLRALPRADSLTSTGPDGRPWPEAMARLLTRQIGEPLAEAALRNDIPRLTPIDDTVSVAVRAQYEENPYPRWSSAGMLDQPIPTPAVIRAMFPHVLLPPEPRWNAPEVLIAGCGTGRESLWSANQFKGASVLAVDLSLTSLAYARRQSERLGIDNIQYGQADILRLDALGRDFDIIQSVGVLHHMDDPMAGWRVLVNLLRPGGLMKIGLYSERARAAITAGREFIAAKGYGFSTAEIRRFRRDVRALPEDHPAHPATRSADFHSTSACRDLLFHVCEHRTTPLEIAERLDTLGLEFLGFQFEDAATAHLYRSRFPGDRTMTDLAQWDAFEEERPNTFGNLYQFWVRHRI